MLEEILDVPRGSLSDADSRESLPGWTSLADVQILTAIQEQFGLEADPDLLGAETIGELMQVLDHRASFS
jgi:acyl carrier protein